MYRFKTVLLSLLSLFLIIACQNSVNKEPQDTTDASSVPSISPEEIESIENTLIKAVQINGQAIEKGNILARMEEYKVPGVSIAIVKDGQLHFAKAYGMANTDKNTPTTTQTLFQAGSISKPVAALAALKLVQEGKVDLDEDVSTYLESWKLPNNNFTYEKKVTLRGLLTHTAGMTVHGFPGYTNKESFPSDLAVLNGEGNTAPITVDTFPGAIWRYSGGGYTVMERIVEDVSGMDFAKYLEENILQPLGMNNSTYAQPLPASLHEQASAAYSPDGAIIEGYWHNYPEQAAAGLWTTPTDLAIYCMAIQAINNGEKGILTKTIIDSMLTPHLNDWGLGPRLQLVGDKQLFSHGGKNAGFTNNLVAFADEGHAIIVMTNGDNGGKLMSDVIRGVSDYYDWNIAKPTFIDLAKISQEQLSAFVGSYETNVELPGIGHYKVEIQAEDDHLIVLDKIENTTAKYYPLEATRFLDLETQEQFVFNPGASGQMSFIYDDYLTFNRLNE